MDADRYVCPTATCPRCGAEVEDHDGFGVLAHVKPYHADGCGYCSHPSRDGDGKGNWTCGICGDVRHLRGRAAGGGDTSGDCERCGMHPVDGDCSCCRTDPAIDAGPTGQTVDECPRDVVEDSAVLYARRKVAKFRFIGWRRVFGNKGERRRNYSALAKRNKRLSAMRRKGKGRVG